MFQITSPTKGKKRQSSEGVDACNEKKPKENEDNIFNNRKANNYVVPSNAGCTPKNVNGGSSLSVSISVKMVNVNFTLSIFARKSLK